VFAFLLTIHLLISAALVIVVLLQSGKGGGLAGAFGGGGGSQTIFGGRGAATFLSRSTAFLGAAFMISSLSLALLVTKGPAKRERSVIENVIRKERAAGQPGQTQQGTEQGRIRPGSFPAGQAPTAGQPAPPAGTQQRVTPGTGQVAPGAGVVPSQTTPSGKASQATQQSKPAGAATTEKKSATGTGGTGTQGQTSEKKTP